MSRKINHPCEEPEWFVGKKCADEPKKITAKQKKVPKHRFVGTEKQYEAFLKEYAVRSRSPSPQRATKKTAKKKVAKKSASPKKSTSPKKSASPKKKVAKKKVVKKPSSPAASESEGPVVVRKPKAKKKTSAKKKSASPVVLKKKSSKPKNVVEAVTERNSDAASLQSMTIAQLKKLAAERGVKLAGATKKADIIAKIDTASKVNVTQLALDATGGDLNESMAIVNASDAAVQEVAEIVRKSSVKVVKEIAKVAKKAGNEDVLALCSELGFEEKDCVIDTVKDDYARAFAAKSKKRTLKTVLEEYKDRMTKDCVDAGISEEDCRDYPAIRKSSGTTLAEKLAAFKNRKAVAISPPEESSEEEPKEEPQKPEESSSESEEEQRPWYEDDARVKRMQDKKCDTKDTYYRVKNNEMECEEKGTEPGEDAIAYRTREDKVIVAKRDALEGLQRIFPGGTVESVGDKTWSKVVEKLPAKPAEKPAEKPALVGQKNSEQLRQEIMAALRACLEQAPK